MVGDEVFEADLLALADWNFSLAPLDGGLPDTKFSDVLVGVVIDVEDDAVVTQAQVDAFHINRNFHAEIVQRPVRAGRAIGGLPHADVPGPGGPAPPTSALDRTSAVLVVAIDIGSGDVMRRVVWCELHGASILGSA